MAISFLVSGRMVYAGQGDRGYRLFCLFPLSPRSACTMGFRLSRAAEWPCILPLTNGKRTVAFAGYEGLCGAGVLRGWSPLSRPKAVLQAGARRARSLCARSEIRDMPLALISQSIRNGFLLPT